MSPEKVLLQLNTMTSSLPGRTWKDVVMLASEEGTTTLLSSLSSSPEHHHHHHRLRHLHSANTLSSTNFIVLFALKHFPFLKKRVTVSCGC